MGWIGSVALTFSAVFTGMRSDPPTDFTTQRYKRHRFPTEISARGVALLCRPRIILIAKRQAASAGLDSSSCDRVSLC